MVFEALKPKLKGLGSWEKIQSGFFWRENDFSWLSTAAEAMQGCQIFIGPKIPKREKYTK
jgi:hypothetical protein